LLCQVQIFEVVQVLKDGFAGIEGLGAACGLRQGFKAGFDFAGESDCKHGLAPFMD
jgi:hypothetical protein